MQTHAVDEGPEVPGHRTPDLALALQEIIFFQPLEVPFNSGAALVMLAPLWGATGNPGEVAQIVLFTGVEYPPISRVGARLVTRNMPLLAGLGTVPLVTLAFLAVAAVGHDMTGWTQGQAELVEGELALVRNPAGSSLV